jgi:hypothetical protein
MEELERGAVFRLAWLHSQFPPDSKTIGIAHLRPSTSDQEQAAAVGGPALVSVFDTERTTIRQAKRIWRQEKPVVAFKFAVPAIRKVGNAEWPEVFRVVRDPLPHPANGLPGADGHCGIEGLVQPPGMPTVLFKEFRASLARLSEPYADGTE